MIPLLCSDTSAGQKGTEKRNHTPSEFDAGAFAAPGSAGLAGIGEEMNS
jgi:hypothetical protein